ncbi:MAG: lysylphosphatidylglycerol synthase transmembrane domain-containing protein [Gaiellales bacterium]
MRRKVITRSLLLLVTAVSLYLLAPSLIDVFSSADELDRLDPMWFGIVLVFVAATFLAIWELQRIALRTSSWFAVGTSQLAGNAFGRVVPGGIAAAGALQYRMLVRGGVDGSRAASGLAAVSIVLFAVMLGLPVLSLPAILGGLKVADGLRETAYVGIGAFAAMLGVGAWFAVSERPLIAVARGVEWLLNRVRRKTRTSGLSERVARERTLVLAAVGSRWWVALLAACGRWLFDYLALVAALAAVGAEPDPSLVLLAFVVASILSSIPITPGGLGFVEAGLTGTLVLAGVGGANAAIATLAYRLASFWAPLPAGLGAYFLARRRCGPEEQDPPA